VETVPWPHTFEASKDEARLIQDSLLPSGTLRGDGFEVAFRPARRRSGALGWWAGASPRMQHFFGVA